MIGFKYIVFILLIAQESWISAFSKMDRLVYPNSKDVITSIPEEEYSALQDLYNSTNGVGWVWGSVALLGPHWFDDAPYPCSTPYWQGLNCSCVGRSCNIVGIALKDYLLIGTLPSSLVNLEYLTVLDFQGNSLYGTIPEFISEFARLETLNLATTNFAGPFPDFITTMPNLEYFIISNTYISGTIPSLIGGLTKLKEFDVTYTNINGTIPEEIFSLVSLQNLEVGGSALSGTLSESVSNLVNLIELEVTDSNINGTIPSSIGRLDKLQLLYLDSNRFSGPLPESLFWLPSLLLCYLYQNNLNGTLSENVGNMTSLYDFAIDNNHFSGSLPKGLGRLVNLRILQLYENRFNGSIPEEFYNATRLNNIYIYYNYFTGTLSPKIGNLKNLTEITFNNNQFTGPVPAEICQCEKMFNFDLFDNFFSKSLPDCIFYYRFNSGLRVDANMLTGTVPRNVTAKNLGTLALYDNSFTGPFPTWLPGLVATIEASNNLFTGTLAATLFREVNAYQSIVIENNFLSGPLPSTIGDLIFLKYLYFTSNLLSGSLPPLYRIHYLVLVFLNENIFSGTVDCFNATSQHFLTTIELSNNQLTGPIPKEPFLSPNLQTFAIVSNCLTGTIPEEVCNSKYLSALALDGLNTASSCQKKILPYFDSYTVRYNTPGTIPWCLFSKSSMQTLHVSGNGLAGSLPSSLTIAPSLLDLIVSHNTFTGTIPEAIAKQQFTNLDLSYNKLTGVLDDTNVTVPDDGYLYLLVNRFSGLIPKKFRDAETISILDGNLFECSYTRQSLPKHDKEYSFYECGTSSLQHAIYAWLVLVCFVFIGGIFVASSPKIRDTVQSATILSCVKLFNTTRDALYIFSDSSKTSFVLPNIRLFGVFLNNLRLSVLVVTVYVVVVLLTINVVLSKYYGTYQYKYAWNVSSVYLSGYTPAVVLLVFLLLWLCWMFGTFHYFLIPFSTVDEKKMLVRGSNGRDSDGSDNAQASDADSKHSNYKHYLWLTAIAVFNCSIVLAVNIGYVYITTQSSPSVVSVVQVLIAVFKLLWNDVVVRGMTTVAHYYSTRKWSGEEVQLTASQQRRIEGQYLSFHTYTMLFNIIVTPCLATAAVSSNCFYTVLFPAPKIALTYNYLTCGNLITPLKNETCELDVTVTTQTSYQPPFSYGYQCSSTLVTTYAVLYVYMFILSGFVQPLLTLLLMRYQSLKNPADSSVVHKQAGRLFHKDRFNLRMLTFLSVYVTFGVIFPPLAVIICVTIWTQSYLKQFRIGYRINTEGSDDQASRLTMMEILERDCVNTADLFKHSLYDVGPMAALFYSFIIFDTYGDAAGGSAAVGVTVTMIVVGTMLTCFAYCLLNVDYKRLLSMQGMVNGDVSSSECEMQRTSSVLHAIGMVNNV